ncbi:PREDICTED: transcription factor TGA2-like [Ipomoea nil]|uniref:transcription factor TGA2-like n=1 Tax=Ipomoea nil TaxID=35883 RepID=UPI0009019356|nr:PREDICTED: transcription factor TGA2-like [Ipomoea nil]
MGSENKFNIKVPFMAASNSKSNQVSVSQPPFQDPAVNNQTCFGTVQAAPSSSSFPALGNKDNSEAYDVGELDQAFLHFLNAQPQDQDPSSSHDQQNNGMRLPNTLNMFPSEPMHVNPSPTALEGSGSGSESRRSSTSSGGGRGGTLNAKTLRRLAQNREAARKCRIRKKAYVQQLETSRMKLIQLEQQVALAQARGARITENGNVVGVGHGHPLSLTKITPEGAAFDVEYARWIEEEHRITCELRKAVDELMLSENELKRYVDACFAHYAQMTHLNAMLAKSDVLHLVSGMCWTPVERCFIWIGGFRPSLLLKVIMSQLEVTEQQALGMIGLRQSTQEAEEALSQGMETLHHTISDIISSDALFYPSNLPSCMTQMAAAITNLYTLHTFVRQADNLRIQTIQRLYHILTVGQVARCFLIVTDFFHRLRTLSALWLGRPRQD